MAYLTKLPYRHFNPTKPQLRITYFADGSKRTERLEAKPDTYQARRFQEQQKEMAERLDPSTFPLVKGEYDQYDGSRNKRISPDKMEKEI